MTGTRESGAFTALSFLAVVASYEALRSRQIYGFYRFLAFERLAMLIAWNSSRWFHNPASLRQIVSWFILGAATVLAARGVSVTRSVERAQHRFIEDTVTVVEVGAYRLIRHPVYASLLLFGWGRFFKAVAPPKRCPATLATTLWTATAPAEERFDIGRPGPAYSECRRRIRMFIPFLL